MDFSFSNIFADPSAGQQFSFASAGQPAGQPASQQYSFTSSTGFSSGNASFATGNPGAADLGMRNGDIAGIVDELKKQTQGSEGLKGIYNPITNPIQNTGQSSALMKSFSPESDQQHALSAIVSAVRGPAVSSSLPGFSRGF